MKRKLYKLATVVMALLIVCATAIPTSAHGSMSVRPSCYRQNCQLWLCSQGNSCNWDWNCTQNWGCSDSCTPDCDETLPDAPDFDIPDVNEPEQPDVNTPSSGTPEKPEQPDNNNDQVTGGSVSELERQVVTLVNRERAAYGLPALTLSVQLSDGARIKSQDMRDNNYFDHNSPTYGSPFDMMKSLGITYSAAGENIAMGYSTVESVVNAWMNSTGHRANILSENYTNIGVGYVDGYWTQWFTK